jgi:hypothetical protein
MFYFFFACKVVTCCSCFVAASKSCAQVGVIRDVCSIELLAYIVHGLEEKE